MTDKMRWRYGDTNPVVAAVDAATVIEIGDLVWQDTDDAKPASSVTQPRQQAAQSKGLGRRLSGRGHATEPQRQCGADSRGHHRRVRVRLRQRHVRVGRFGRRRYEHRGHRLVEPAGGESRDSLHAIGRIAKRQSTATTNVLVDIRSTIMTGGVANSHSGT